jgi:hypothetical protein
VKPETITQVDVNAFLELMNQNQRIGYNSEDATINEIGSDQ